jgi:hypothetical protein
VLEYSDGTIYQGNFVKHMLNGKGKYTFNDQNQYIGDVLASKRHGNGTFVSINGGFEYNGEWKNGSMNGTGIAIYKSGA